MPPYLLLCSQAGSTAHKALLTHTHGGVPHDALSFPCLQVCKDLRHSGVSEPCDLEQQTQAAVWTFHRQRSGTSGATALVVEFSDGALELLLLSTGSADATRAQVLAQAPRQEAGDPPAGGRHPGAPSYALHSGRSVSWQLRNLPERWLAAYLAGVPFGRGLLSSDGACCHVA